MMLMIDNYDSFSHNLLRYFEEIGENMIIRRNDKITLDEIEELKPSGIVISPGPKSPEDSGICGEVVERFKGRVPILGICLGHQVISHQFNSPVIKGAEPVHGKVHEIKNDGKGVFRGLPEKFKVTRYHSLEVDRDNISEELVVTSYTEDGVIMGVRHKEYEIEGVQFHPEAVLTEYGHEMLKNFVLKCSKK